jgi:hypothetical protein
VRDLSGFINKIAEMTAKDGKHHDFSLSYSKARTGFTVHCNNLPQDLAMLKLKRHCELRKYREKLIKWFGLAIQPESAKVRFGLVLDHPWQQDNAMDEDVAKMPKAQPVENLRAFAKSRGMSRKIGRNKPCHCGSGLKYKNCHLRKDQRGM